jgi:hypothetical protein
MYYYAINLIKLNKYIYFINIFLLYYNIVRNKFKNKINELFIC